MELFQAFWGPNMRFATDQGFLKDDLPQSPDRATTNQLINDYYMTIDERATNNDLKAQLQTLVSVKTVLSYDGVWAAFASTGKHIEGYPCSSDPD